MTESADILSPSEAGDEFYVGYLPVPASQRVFLRVALPAVLWLMMAAVAMFVAGMERDPGGGVWLDQTETFTGLLVVDPYARLLVVDEDGSVSSLFVVEAGKLGGGARAERFSGVAVRITGTRLEREGRKMIALSPGDGAIAESGDAPDIVRASPDARTVSIAGEIVDFKCYLGAMKPGDGKTHRVCATLCVRGGIPPVLVTTAASGARSYYVLVGPSGQALNFDVLGFIAEPVRVTGDVQTRDGVLFLRTDPAGIERLR